MLMLWFIYVLISIVLMSFTVFIAKTIMPEVNPLVVLFYQYLIATPLVLLYSLVSGAMIGTGSPLLLLIGVIYVAAIGSYYVALSRESLSRVSPIVNLKMVVTVVLSIVLLSEPFSLKLFAGVVLGGISIYLLGGKK